MKILLAGIMLFLSITSFAKSDEALCFQLKDDKIRFEQNLEKITGLDSFTLQQANSFYAISFWTRYEFKKIYDEDNSNIDAGNFYVLFERQEYVFGLLRQAVVSFQGNGEMEALKMFGNTPLVSLAKNIDEKLGYINFFENEIKKAYGQIKVLDSLLKEATQRYCTLLD